MPQSRKAAGPMLTVVAALIESEGKLLVCQRRRGSAFEVMWEFPGGKVKPGETDAEALRRELQEELGVAAKIGSEIYRTQHIYKEMIEPIELVFFSVSIAPPEMRNLVFERIQWREPKSLPELNFLPADRELIERLAAGAIQLPRVE
jgi:mutator protein MutT